MDKITVVLATLLFLVSGFVSADDDLTDDVFDEVKFENSARAQYTLGLMYLQGKGVEQDKQSALSWLKKSSEQGYYLALHRLGRIYLDDKKEALAVKHIAQAAEMGYSPSQYLLGTLYQTGEKGVKKNPQEAIKWLSMAAEQGHKLAKQVLAKLTAGDVLTDETMDVQAVVAKGMQYLKGKGVSRDYKQAAEWFSRAAEQGDAEAQYQLGELLSKGRGVKKDKKLAQKWYKAAAEQGHIKAKYRTRNCAFC
ncbi:MAG TPA: sel1 repeat family protein [Gammaproteobacteria bacterium]|nr:sel1 repeat family protein [Gammaproteobacteria bacterium]